MNLSRAWPITYRTGTSIFHLKNNNAESWAKYSSLFSNGLCIPDTKKNQIGIITIVIKINPIIRINLLTIFEETVGLTSPGFPIFKTSR